MAAQQIIDLEPDEFESSIKLIPYVPEGKSQAEEDSNSLKQEFRISYRVTEHLPDWRHVKPLMAKQYTLMPPRYLASTGRTCGNLNVDPKCYDPHSGFQYFLTLEMNQAEAGPAFSYCKASCLAGFTTVPLHEISTRDGQYSIWDMSVHAGQYPLTLRLELHYLTDVSEEFVRLYCDSSQNPASKSSLLNDANTTGDLQLVCEVSEP
jgi:hypothetical protein